MGKLNTGECLISRQIISAGPREGSASGDTGMGHEVIDEVIYLLDDEKKNEKFRVEDEFESYIEELSKKNKEYCIDEFDKKCEEELIVDDENFSHRNIKSLKEDLHSRVYEDIDSRRDDDSDSRGDEDTDSRKGDEDTDSRREEFINSRADQKPYTVSVVHDSLKKGEGLRETDSLPKTTLDNPEKEKKIITNGELHSSLSKAFYGNHHKYMYLDNHPTNEDEEVDIIGGEDSDIEEIIVESEAIEIHDDDSDDISLSSTEEADPLSPDPKRPRLDSSEIKPIQLKKKVLSKPFKSNKPGQHKKLSESTSNARCHSSVSSYSEDKRVKKNDGTRLEERENAGVPIKTLNWSSQQSSNLEKKSIIIGGVIKKIVSSTDLKGVTVPRKPMEAFIDKNSLKAVIKPIPGNKNTIVNELTNQMKPVRLLNSAHSLLRPKQGTESPQGGGTFIRLSDMNAKSNSSQPLKSPIKLPKTIKVLKSPVLASHLLQSSPKSPLNSVLKPSQSIKTVNHTSSNGLPLLKYSPGTSSPSGKTVTLSCCYCNMVFTKQETLQLHKLTKHKDLLPNPNLSSLRPIRPKLTSGKPVYLSVKNGKTQLKNVFIVPKNSNIVKKVIPQPQPVVEKSRAPPTTTSLVTLADILELERELRDRKQNCFECYFGEENVYKHKRHARVHPHGDDSCERCQDSLSHYKTYMIHLESHTHADSEDSDCEFISDEGLT